MYKYLCFEAERGAKSKKRKERKNKHAVVRNSPTRAITFARGAAILSKLSVIS